MYGVNSQATARKQDSAIHGESKTSHTVSLGMLLILAQGSVGKLSEGSCYIYVLRIVNSHQRFSEAKYINITRPCGKITDACFPTSSHGKMRGKSQAGRPQDSAGHVETRRHRQQCADCTRDTGRSRTRPLQHLIPECSAHWCCSILCILERRGSTVTLVIQDTETPRNVTYIPSDCGR